MGLGVSELSVWCLDLVLGVTFWVLEFGVWCLGFQVEA